MAILILLLGLVKCKWPKAQLSLYTLLANRAGWKVIWCLRRHKIMHDVGSLCIFTMWLLNFFLIKKKPWSRSCRGRRQVAKGTQGKQTIMHFSTTRLPCISSSSLSSSFFSSSSSFVSPSYRGFGNPSDPPSSPAGTCRTNTRMSAYKVCLLLP